MKDYIDDSEHGEARVILKLMEDRQLVNKAVFVAQKFGGVKLFEMRFQKIEQVVTDV